MASLAGFQAQHLGSQGAWHDLGQGLFISCSAKVPFIDLNKQLHLTPGSPPAALNQRKLLLYFITLLCKFELEEGGAKAKLLYGSAAATEQVRLQAGFAPQILPLFSLASLSIVGAAAEQAWCTPRRPVCLATFGLKSRGPGGLRAVRAEGWAEPSAGTWEDAPSGQHLAGTWLCDWGSHCVSDFQLVLWVKFRDGARHF